MAPRRGFTMIELAMVAVVAAILAVFAFSDSETSANEEGKSASLCFESDVQFARAQSIAQPDDPIVIKLDIANNKYWLAKASDPDTPITHPQKHKPYVVCYGPNGQAGFKNVSIYANDFGGDQVIQFDSTGSIDQQTPALLQLMSGSAKYEVSVAPWSANCDVNDDFINTLPPPAGGQTGGTGKTGGATLPNLGETIEPDLGV